MNISENEIKINQALANLPVARFDINMLGIPLEYEEWFFNDAVKHVGIEIAERFLKNVFEKINSRPQIGNYFSSNKIDTYEARFIVLTEDQIRKLLENLILKIAMERDNNAEKIKLVLGVIKLLAETSSFHVDKMKKENKV